MFWDAVQCNCYLTWSSLPLLRHKATTLALQWTLFFAISFHHPVSSQYCPTLLSLRVSMVFSFSFSPGDFASWPFWWCYGFPFFKAWPIHFLFLHFLVLATCVSFCLVLACSSSFMMTYSQKMPSIRQNLFVEICYSCVLRWFPSKRTHRRFQMKLDMLMLQDKEMLKT